MDEDTANMRKAQDHHGCGTMIGRGRMVAGSERVDAHRTSRIGRLSLDEWRQTAHACSSGQR